ncbi:MAG: hypothetical protein WD066_15865 [Planctomycetaceae bacterium]
MHDAVQSPESQFQVSRGDIEIGVAFLRALFDESDTVLFRPIETWGEAGRKRSLVAYKHTAYRKAAPEVLRQTLQFLLKLAAEERVNLFFGTCPRIDGKGRFDLAWQIRTVRALWADIDHVTVEEARERVAKASLPTASIVVNSGNGVHLYWLLDVPYLIDDAGDPPQVETEWIELPGGRKKPRKYIVENGDRVYLDQHRHVSRLSPKAQRLQDILAGIAQACGGDHTTDLSRLLRIPGTLNRKDERNGREPVPTALVECEPSRRFTLATFEPFATPAPETVRFEQIAKMPLPRPRKASATKADKLAELVAASALAPAGGRSEADFSLCCYSIRSGIEREEVWGQVEQVGKFAEQGRRYFDRTWESAEFDVRAATYEKLQKKAKPKGPPVAVPGICVEGVGGLAHDGDEEGSGGGRPTVVVDPHSTPVGDTLHEVTSRLLRTGTCFSRAGQLVVINDHDVKAILTPPEIAGLLNQHVEFFFVDGEGGEYKPFPSSYANTWLNNHAERSRLPAINLFTRNPVYTDDWRLVTPGFDSASGIYYAGTAIEPRYDTEHLDALLRDFCFKTPADRTNYLGVLLTAILIPRFIGSKPAALFNGNQPGLGKTILAQTIAILRDGQSAETATYNRNDEEFEKTLGAIVRRGVTTVVIDNAKGGRSGDRIESACLERCITDKILSFRLLGQSATIRAENSHIFCITANTTDVGRDIVTRSVVINLHHEGDPARRKFAIADPEGYAEDHRLELLGELLGMVERWKASGRALADTGTRFNKRGWGNIVGGILEACGEPDFLANAEEAAATLDETRRDFAELVALLADHPQGTFTAGDLVEICKPNGLLILDLGEGSSRSLATKMGTLAGRFITERFPLTGDRTAVFHRGQDRKGNIYRVGIEYGVPNLGTFAEPMPNLEIA